MLPDCNLEYKETNRDLLVANYNNYWARITTKNQIVGSSGIQGDKTMADELMYISNDDTQNYPFL